MYLAYLDTRLRSSNGYAIACDGGDDSSGVKYLDLRARLFANGEICNMHL
jgi:hypothetical protein